MRILRVKGEAIYATSHPRSFFNGKNMPAIAEVGSASDGACSCRVNSGLWIDLHNEIYTELEQESRSQGKTITEEVKKDLKREASKRFMLQVYLPDVKHIVMERRGDMVMNGSVVYDVTDHGLELEWKGKRVTAEYEFIIKRREKGTENTEESKTFYLAQQAMMTSPNAEAWFPVHEKNKNGEYQIRYANYWKRVGNQVLTKTVRIADERTDLSLAEAQEVIRQQTSNRFLETQATPEAYVFSTTSIKADEALAPMIKEMTNDFAKPNNEAKSIISPPLEKGEKRPSGGMVPVVVEEAEEVGRRVKRDTAQAIGSLWTAIHRRNVKGDDRKKFVAFKRLSDQILKETRDSENWLTKEIVATPVAHGAQVKKNWQTIRTQLQEKVAFKAAVVLAAETGVGAAEKSIRRHEKKELRRKNTELRKRKQEARKDPVKVQPWNTERVESSKPRKERKERIRMREGSQRGKEYKKRKVYLELATAGRRYTLGGKELLLEMRVQRERSERSERRGQRKRLERMHWLAKRAEGILESKRLSKKNKKLWITLAVAASEFARLVLQRESLFGRKKRERISSPMRKGVSSRPSLEVKKERVAMAGVQFAWVVYWFLNTERNLKRFHLTSLQGETFKTTSARKCTEWRERSGEVFKVQEGLPWVLFSIIWYLVMLREQGMTTMSNIKFQASNKKKKIKKRRTPAWSPLAPRGVIFAFSS